MVMTFTTKQPIILAALIGLFLAGPMEIRAEDWRENAGVGVGVAVGNLFYVPIKATLAVFTVPQSLIAFVTTGGDTEVAN